MPYELRLVAENWLLNATGDDEKSVYVYCGPGVLLVVHSQDKRQETLHPQSAAVLLMVG